jgi:cytochrome c5
MAVWMSTSKIAACAAIALAGSAGTHAHEVPDFAGAELYQHFCASCHGLAARGDGPVAASIKSKVPDLTRIAARHGGTFPTQQVRQKIDGQISMPAHGPRNMPVWGWEFYAIQGEDPARRERVVALIARLVDYLESMQRK